MTTTSLMVMRRNKEARRAAKEAVWKQNDDK